MKILRFRLLLTFILATTLFMNIAFAQTLKDPYLTTNPSLIVAFEGDFSSSPSAKQEAHRATAGQWDYITVTHDKKLVETGVIRSFDLIENKDSGENFNGLTGTL